jgi:DnaK suppressor protein
VLKESKLLKLRQRLEDEQERIEHHIVELEDMLRLQDREISSGEDDADVAARVVAYNGLMVILESEEQTLAEVEEALQAMDDETYGLCIDCGREILLARLEARPYARRCINCQEREQG